MLRLMYIKFLFSLWLLLSVSVQAQTYSDLLLKAQASVFPKIVLLDKQLDQKLVEQSISICIVYDSEDELAAQNFKKYILEKFNNQINKQPLNIVLDSHDEDAQFPLATAYISISNNNNVIAHLAQFASSEGRIVFSHTVDDFKTNTLLSLNVLEKTYIYLNRAAMKDYQIEFPRSFYKIVTIR